MKKLLYILVCGGSGWLLGYDAMGQDIKALRKQKPFDIRGNLSVGVSYYTAIGIANRRQPYYWYLSGAPTVSLWGVSFPFSITVSEQERRFSQPFNQYGASPNYKWLKLHAGYRNVRFSNHTLAGSAFLGGGIELNPGLFRLGVVYGRFARAVAEDSTALDPRIRFVRPAYRRMGYGAKIGIGNATNYFDLVAFKASDDLSSIPTPSARSRVQPQENISVGAKSQFGLFNKKLTFDFDVAASALTRDLLRNDVERAALPAFLQKTTLLTINSSTLWATAGHISARYSFNGGGLQVMYKRVDPNYLSLGAYYFQNDLEQLTIDPSFGLFKGKVSVSGSYGLMRDNLAKTKVATTNRVVGSANLNILLSTKLNLNFNYANFGVSQNRGINDAFNDSTAISLVNTSFGGSVSYSTSNKAYSQSVNLFGSYQLTDDQNIYTRAFSNANSVFGTASYNQTFLSSGANLGGAVSFSQIVTANRQIRLLGPNLNVGIPFFDRKLRTGLNVNCQFRQANGRKDGLTASTGLNLGYRLKKQTVSLTGNYVYNRFEAQSDGLAFRDFHEFRTSLSYGISFGR